MLSARPRLSWLSSDASSLSWGMLFYFSLYQGMLTTLVQTEETRRQRVPLWCSKRTISRKKISKWAFLFSHHFSHRVTYTSIIVMLLLPLRTLLLRLPSPDQISSVLGFRVFCYTYILFYFFFFPWLLFLYC